MNLNKRILALLLVTVMLVSVLTSCKPRDDQSSSSSSVSSSADGALVEGDKVSSIIPDFAGEIAEKKAINEDSIGWLSVPGTDIYDVVLVNYTDNQYYVRRDFEKVYNFNGVYYADRRSTFGDGSVEELGVNTCIYGHALTDIKEKDSYNTKFGPLHNFRDEEWAKENPYIFFSTEKENLAFEVFAVFVANTDNTGVPYNRNDIEPADFVKMIEEEIMPRSKYDYDVKLTKEDKFLTLSTCIYTLDNGTVTNYPNTYYRYAIMGRLVDPDSPLKETAEFTLNEDVIYDPDGKWKAAA